MDRASDEFFETFMVMERREAGNKVPVHRKGARTKILITETGHGSFSRLGGECFRMVQMGDTTNSQGQL
jgi:hypothetical protein